MLNTFLMIKDIMQDVFEITIYVNMIVIILTNLMYLNQYIHGFVGVLTKKKTFKEASKNHKYAYLIACRNEEKVVGYLIDSIFKQDYPKELMQVFVVADNCSDNTANVAKDHGAIVFERFDEVNKGKSYALDYLFKKIINDSQYDDIEAFFVFDADNLVSKDYTTQMNKVYDSGSLVSTSLRDSKNYDASWLAAGQSMSFYREHLLIHHSRSRLNIGTYVNGTGFFVARSVITKFNGWPFNTMIEDIEFSINCALNDIKIDYCEDAVFFDEQPVTLKASCKQRLRWCKGVLQCFNKYVGKTAKKMCKKPTLTMLESILHVTPTHIISFIWTILYLLINLVFVFSGVISFDNYLYSVINGVLGFIINILVFFISHALFVEIRYAKKINAPWYKQVLYVLTFPVFMILYLPILFMALISKVEWEKIEHSVTKDIDEM